MGEVVGLDAHGPSNVVSLKANFPELASCGGVETVGYVDGHDVSQPLGESNVPKRCLVVPAVSATVVAAEVVGGFFGA